LRGFFVLVVVLVLDFTIRGCGKARPLRGCPLRGFFVLVVVLVLDFTIRGG
jgi:hypothetical protein